MAANTRDNPPTGVAPPSAAATTERESRGDSRSDWGTPSQRLLGAVLAVLGVMGLFGATISNALTGPQNRLRAGEFIAVLAAATVLVVAGAVYEWSRERTRIRVDEERAKREADADERRRLHEARLASAE